jgi:hypothetical protein
MFNDPLDMLPDEDYRIHPPRTRDFLADIWKRDDHLFDGRALPVQGNRLRIRLLFVKLPNFITIFLFPVVFEHLGIPLSTALVSLFSLTGFLAACFILPEVYGYVEHEK